MPRVFLCHSSADKRIVGQIANDLSIRAEGVTLLNEAYSSINSGERFQMPEDISSIEQARELVLRKMAEARKELKQGNIEDSVRSLLEVAIMVVTPMNFRPDFRHYLFKSDLTSIITTS